MRFMVGFGLLLGLAGLAWSQPGGHHEDPPGSLTIEDIQAGQSDGQTPQPESAELTVAPEAGHKTVEISAPANEAVHQVRWDLHVYVHQDQQACLAAYRGNDRRYYTARKASSVARAKLVKAGVPSAKLADPDFLKRFETQFKLGNKFADAWLVERIRKMTLDPKTVLGKLQIVVNDHEKRLKALEDKIGVQPQDEIGTEKSETASAIPNQFTDEETARLKMLAASQVLYTAADGGELATAAGMEAFVAGEIAKIEHPEATGAALDKWIPWAAGAGVVGLILALLALFRRRGAAGLTEDRVETIADKQINERLVPRDVVMADLMEGMINSHAATPHGGVSLEQVEEIIQHHPLWDSIPSRVDHLVHTHPVIGGIQTTLDSLGEKMGVMGESINNLLRTVGAQFAPVTATPIPDATAASSSGEGQAATAISPDQPGTEEQKESPKEGDDPNQAS